MKTIEAKCPGVISLIIEKNNNNYLARRDFVDTFNTMEISLYKESMKVKEQPWNPILHAGLLFFKELDIKGYKLETSLNRSIKTGLGLLEDDVLEAGTLRAMNELCETRLSDDELYLLGSKINNRVPSILRNETILVNQDEQYVRSDTNSKDSFYDLIQLSDYYKDYDLSNFFIDEGINMDPSDPKYQELLFIKKVLEKYNVKNMSMNGNNNIVIGSFQDIHDRFTAYKELKDHNYPVTQLNRGNCITMIKRYK